MNRDTKATLKRALALLRAGDNQAAAQLLAHTISEEPNNEHAWFLLGAAIDDREKQIYAFQQVLKLNPANDKARRRLEKLGVTPPKAPEKPAVMPAKRPAAKTRPVKRKKKKSALSAAVTVGILVVLSVVGIGAIYFGPGLLSTYYQADATSQPVAGITSIASITPTATFTPHPTLTPRPTNTAAPSPTATLLPTETPPPSPTPTTLPLPDDVQAEIITIQEEVVALRGLEILEPVNDEIMPLLKLQILLTDLFITEEYLAELPDQALVLIALGLMDPTYDLVNNTLDSKADSIGGFYLPDDNRIHVIGTGFYGVEKWIYAHEFTHALNDQHFDLNSLGVYPECVRPQQACLAIRALVEGDAEFVQELWLENNLDQFEAHDILRFTTQPSPLFQSQTPPPYFGLRSYFPYAVGSQFIAALYAHGGWPLVNHAYTLHPLTTEQIMHPEKYITFEPEVLVNDPALEDVLSADWRMVERDSLGEWDTYLLLAWGASEYARQPDSLAQTAAAGWGGDTYQVYHNDQFEQSLLAVHWTWDTPKDQTEFYEQLRAHLTSYFLNAEVDGPDNGICWQQGQTFSCLYDNDQDTLWLLSPDLSVLETIKALFPQFP